MSARNHTKLICSICCALAGWMLGAAPVGAARIVEFQLESDHLTRLIQHRLMQEDICSTTPFELPLVGGVVALDHVSFPEGVVLRRLGTVVQVAVPVEVYTKTEACIQDPQCAPQDYTPSVPLPLTVVFDIEASQTGNGQLLLCAEHSALEFSGLTVGPGVLDPQLVDMLTPLTQPVCSALDVLAPLEQLLGELPDVQRLGVGTDNGLQRFAIRLELIDPNDPGQPSDDASWFEFQAGNLAPLASGMDWSVFIDDAVVVDAVLSRFTANQGTAASLEIVSGPTGSWGPLGDAGGRVTLTLAAEVDVPICPNSIGVDPATIELTLTADASSPNTVFTHGVLDTDIVDSDVLLCATFTGSAIFPAVLTTMAVVAANAGPGGNDYPDQCTSMNDGEVFDCSEPVILPPILLNKYGSIWGTRASLSLTRLYGHDAGLIIGGPSVVVLGHPGPTKDLLTVSDGAFDYGVTGSCSALSIGYSGALEMTGDGRICQLEVIDDPLNVFGIVAVGAHPLGADYIGQGRFAYTVELVFPQFGANLDAYFAAPYPMHLLVRTSVGARTVEIAAPTESTDMLDLILEGQLARTRADCLVEISYIVERLSFLWLIDPPPWHAPLTVVFDDGLGDGWATEVEIVDVEMIPQSELRGVPDSSGALRAEDVRMTMQVTARVPASAIQITADDARALAGVDRAATGEPALEFVFEAPVTFGVDVHMEDGAVRANLATTDVVQQLLSVPPEVLPDGIREMTVAVELNPAEILFTGAVERVEPDDVLPDDLARGDSGACGLGAAGMVPLMVLGLGALGRRRRLV